MELVGLGLLLRSTTNDEKVSDQQGGGSLHHRDSPVNVPLVRLARGALRGLRPSLRGRGQLIPMFYGAWLRPLDATAATNAARAALSKGRLWRRLQVSATSTSTSTFFTARDCHCWATNLKTRQSWGVPLRPVSVNAPRVYSSMVPCQKPRPLRFAVETRTTHSPGRRFQRRNAA